MSDAKSEQAKLARSAHIFAMVNVAIWGLAIIAMVVVMERGSSVRGMFPILAGGVAVGISLISVVTRLGQQA
jgi:hypothetical protein